MSGPEHLQVVLMFLLLTDVDMLIPTARGTMRYFGSTITSGYQRQLSLALHCLVSVALGEASFVHLSLEGLACGMELQRRGAAKSSQAKAHDMLCILLGLVLAPPHVRTHPTPTSLPFDSSGACSLEWCFVCLLSCLPHLERHSWPNLYAARLNNKNRSLRQRRFVHRTVVCDLHASLCRHIDRCTCVCMFKYRHSYADAFADAYACACAAACTCACMEI